MEIFLFLLLATGLAANLVWTVYLLRKHKWSRQSPSADLSGLDARVEKLLSEIHRVTSANVELIEGRIDALREVGGLADERLKRIRFTLTELEVLLNRVSRVKKAMSPSSPGEEPDMDYALTDRVEIPEPAPSPVSAAPSNSRKETGLNLYRQGLTERQIAQKMGLGIADVRFLLNMAESGEIRQPKVAERR